MHGVDQAVGDVQCHGKVRNSLQVAAPPVAVRCVGCSAGAVAIDALDEDEPVGIDGQDSIARPFRCQSPIETRIATAPTGRAVRLVMQVGANDHGIIFITVCQHLPVSDPAGLRILRGVPERGLSIGVGAMLIEDDMQTDLAGIADDLIHDL